MLNNGWMFKSVTSHELVTILLYARSYLEFFFAIRYLAEMKVFVDVLHSDVLHSEGRRRLELLVGEKPFKASSSASFRVARRLANRLANWLPTLAAQRCRDQQSPSRAFRFGRSNTFSLKYLKSR